MGWAMQAEFWGVAMAHGASHPKRFAQPGDLGDPGTSVEPRGFRGFAFHSLRMGTSMPWLDFHAGLWPVLLVVYIGIVIWIVGMFAARSERGAFISQLIFSLRYFGFRGSI